MNFDKRTLVITHMATLFGHTLSLEQQQVVSGALRELSEATGTVYLTVEQAIEDGYYPDIIGLLLDELDEENGGENGDE